MNRGMKIVSVLVAFGLLGALVGCSATRGDIVTATSMNSQTSTFNHLLKVAQLDKTYSKGGPYTFFAPSDEAFAKLPEGTLQDLEKPDNRGKLVSILTYHIVNGNMKSNELANNMDLKTDNGKMVKITEKNGQWFYGDGRIVNTDMGTWNGTYHVIDTVQMP